jgi:hypothetical protein
MNGRKVALHVAFFLTVLLTLGGVDRLFAQRGESPFHPEFRPDSGRQLSPPVVYKPIYECAEAVHVSGFVPHAHIKVLANGTELVGEADPPFGFTDVPINLVRPLKFGETISATQTVDGLTGDPSIHPVSVEHRPTFPGGLPTPKVQPPRQNLRPRRQLDRKRTRGGEVAADLDRSAHQRSRHNGSAFRL